MEEYTVIGKLNKTFGNEGLLRYTIYNDYSSDFSKSKFIFILLDGIYVPFPIDPSFRPNHKELKLLFVDSVKHSEEIAGKEIFLDNKSISLKKEIESDLAFAFLKGYSAFYNDGISLGSIDEVEAFPMQEMAVIDGDEKILIPLHDSLIESLDREKKEVHFDLPEGLI